MIETWMQLMNREMLIGKEGDKGVQPNGASRKSVERGG